MGSKYILGWGLGGVKTANEAPGSTGPEAPCFPRERLEAETSGELSRQQGGVGCRAQTLVTLRQSRLHLLGGGALGCPSQLCNRPCWPSSVDVFSRAFF